MNAGPDTTSCGNPVTLFATTTPKAGTSDYVPSSIPYNPNNFSGGVSVPLTDDGYSNALPIGFSFTFYGDSYSQFFISANGWISFTQANTFEIYNNNPSSWPSNSNNVPKNAIAMWDDWNPAQGGNVNYYTTGTAPNRKLVVNWNNVPHYSCTSEIYKGQIVLYETSNLIEFYTETKGTCTTWQSGKSTQGLHDPAGFNAVTIAGRNAAVFSLTNDAYRFSPNGPPESTAVTWYEGSNVIGTNLSVTVSPSATTTYVVELTYSPTSITFTDTIEVKVDNTVLTMSSTDVLCNGGSTGSATVNAVGTNPPSYSYSWSTIPVQTSATATDLTQGTYTVLVSQGVCSWTQSVIVNEPVPLVVSASPESETCGDENGKVATAVTGGTFPYSYVWSDGSNNDSLLNVKAGSYNVTVTDANGCTFTQIALVEQINNVEASFTASPLEGIVPLLVTFTNNSSGAETYSWNFQAGSSMDQNPSFTFTESGTYDVKLVAIHNGMCRDSMTLTITVLDSLEKVKPVTIPNVLVANSSNPENRMFSVKGDSIEELNVELFNRWGKQVFASTVQEDGWTSESEPAGTYFYIVRYRVKDQSEFVTERGFVTVFK